MRLSIMAHWWGPAVHEIIRVMDGSGHCSKKTDGLIGSLHVTDNEVDNESYIYLCKPSSARGAGHTQIHKIEYLDYLVLSQD